jgi:DNA modification methylase
MFIPVVNLMTGVINLMTSVISLITDFRNKNHLGVRGNFRMKIEKRKIADLSQDPANVRKHPERNLDAIVASLRRFGQQHPIVIDINNTVRAGNGRLQAAIALGWDEIDCVVTDLKGSEAIAYAIADNRTAELAEWDDDMLAAQLHGLLTDDEALLEAAGFDEDELAAMLDELEGDGTTGEIVEDEVPEPPADPITKPGDLWILGKHRLLCGDSTKAEDVARLMGGEKAQLIHADPPYGMGKEKDGVANDNLYRDKLDAFQMDWWRVFRKHTDDNASAYIWGNAEDLWRLWYVGGLKDSERLTFRSQVIWDKPPSAGPCGSPIGSEVMRSYPHGYEVCLFFMLGEQGFNNNADNYWEGWEPIRSYLEGERVKSGLTTAQCNEICGKQNMTQAAFTRGGFRLILKEDYEKLQAACNGNAFKREHDELKREHDELKREHDELKREFYATRAYFDNTHDNMTDVWEFPRVTGEERHGHATPKPVAMMVRAIKSSCPDGGIVAEPFGGSGSTLIAAEQCGRACYTMEISPAYCDVIVKRWENLTGQKAVCQSATPA